MSARQKSRVIKHVVRAGKQSSEKLGLERDAPVNPGRHECHCPICSHAKCNQDR